MASPNEREIAEEAAKALGLTQLLPAMYQDLLQPAAREVGENLIVVAKAVSIALAPLKAAVWGYDQIQAFLLPKIAAKLAHKPTQEIKAPDMVVAGPVIMAMAFAAEAPHLREMYANLLAAAMHGPSATKAHPSFVQAVQQLSPEEALILHKIAGFDFSIQDEVSMNYNSLLSQPVHVLVKARWRKSCLAWGLPETALTDAYLNNLIRLGLLGHQYQVLSDPFSGPVGLKGTSFLHVTDYGKLFLDVCVREDDSL
jgi:hypothetical protein